jgi:hypothetical protein
MANMNMSQLTGGSYGGSHDPSVDHLHVLPFPYWHEFMRHYVCSHISTAVSWVTQMVPTPMEHLVKEIGCLLVSSSFTSSSLAQITHINFFFPGIYMPTDSELESCQAANDPWDGSAYYGYWATYFILAAFLAVSISSGIKRLHNLNRWVNTALDMAIDLWLTHPHFFLWWYIELWAFRACSDFIPRFPHFSEQWAIPSCDSGEDPSLRWAPASCFLGFSCLVHWFASCADRITDHPTLVALHCKVESLLNKSTAGFLNSLRGLLSTFIY